MPGKKMNGAVLCAMLLLIAMGSCELTGGADLPFTMPAIPEKQAVISGSVIKAACYVDAERYNPLNVMDYTLEDGGCFFDFAVITAAQIKKDSRGIYIHLPGGLRGLLEQRDTYIVPLQKKGIKVLLSITGGGDAANFGDLSEDDITVFSRLIKETVDNYKLDGVEFYDNGAGAPPAIKVYPTDLYTDEEEILDGWTRGGDCMNNIIYFTRQLFLAQFQDKTIIVREKNFGAWLPPDVSGSEGEATFSGTAEQINYFINPRFGSFDESLINENSGAYFIYNNQYAPLLANLGDESTGTTIPPIYDAGGAGITDFTDQFNEMADYGLLCYFNLKSNTEASSRNYLQDTRPEASAGSRLTQAEYISLTTQTLFGKAVICSGGDYRKDW
jgi:hypothetical protein